MSKLLAEVRSKNWNAMKRKLTQRIPQDQESHELKITKMNYQLQVYTLRYYHEPDVPPSHLNHGLRMSGGLCTPNRYTQSAHPQSLNDAVEQRGES